MLDAETTAATDPQTILQLRRQMSELARGYRTAQVLLTCVELGVFEAIAAGELERTSETVFRFTGAAPLTLEDYFRAFPELLRALRAGQDRTSGG